MSPEERPPSRDELLAMAYVDGELDAGDREEFEQRMSQSDKLRREVAELSSLAVLARRMAPKEPKDYEWERLAEDPVHRGGLGLGFGLVVAGVLGLAAFGITKVATDDGIPITLKLVLGAMTGGLLCLFLVVLRARLRTLPYDPYTEVQR